MNNFKFCAFADEADQNISGQIEALAENGVTLLEMRGVDGKNVSTITLNQAKEVKAKLDAGGISTWSIGSPIGKIKLEDPFAPHLDTFCHCLEIANVLGAKNIRLFSFYGAQNEDGTYNEEAVFERLAQFVEKSRGSGVTLCHENESGIFGSSLANCIKIHQTFPEIKAIFDPANFIHCKEDTAKAWPHLAPHMAYLHIKDADENGKVVPAGQGIGNLPFILAEYGKQGGGVLSVEPHLKPQEHGGVRGAFNVAVSALKKCLEEIGVTFT